jgi:hypothetical protein
MNTSKDREEKQRQVKLDDIETQIKNGGLVVRQMTKAERRNDPPKNLKPKRRGR